MSAPKSAPGPSELSEESTDKARTLDSDWLYKVDEQVFGPVKPRELLELLYAGELHAHSPIALDVDPPIYEQLQNYSVFRVHLPKVHQHQEILADRHRLEAQSARARRHRQLKWSAIALGLTLVAMGIVLRLAHDRRQVEALTQARAYEAELMKATDDLLAHISIEPPLVGLVRDADNAKSDVSDARKKRRRAIARFTTGPSGKGSHTSELTRDEILTNIAVAFPGFKRCIIDQIRRDNESIAEQIVLSFSISNEGLAQQIMLTDHALRNTPLAECMAVKLSQVRFRRYIGEVQNVEYPITIGRR